MKIHGIEISDEKFKEFYIATFLENWNVEVNISDDLQEVIVPDSADPKSAAKIKDL